GALRHPLPKGESPEGRGTHPCMTAKLKSTPHKRLSRQQGCNLDNSGLCPPAVCDIMGGHRPPLQFGSAMIPVCRRMLLNWPGTTDNKHHDSNSLVFRHAAFQPSVFHSELPAGPVHPSAFVGIPLDKGASRSLC